MINSENLDICPFCNKTIPQGPAYFCPTCGKKLDEKYSKRQIILDNTDVIVDENDFDGSSIDEFEDIASLIESNSSSSKNFISEINQDENSEDIVKNNDEDEQISVENIEDDLADFEDEIIENDDSIEDNLKSQNNSIKLDLFLKYCVDNQFSYNFLRYKTVDASQ